MAKCDHYEICCREALEGTAESLCILHSPSPRKDKEAFDAALAEHRKEKGDRFDRFVFPGAVEFIDATFTEWVSFFYATFTQRVDFSHARFTEGANFSGAKFADSTNFFEATFDKGAKFSDAEFTRWANFGLATFSGWAFFARTTFIEGASFSSAEFMSSAEFFDAKFPVDADFIGATFTNGAYFSGTTFGERTNFLRARFLGRTLFLSRQADGRTIPIFSGTAVSFRKVTSAPLDVLTFRDADLQKCLFLGTDLRKAEFANVIWPKIGSRFGAYDEIANLREGETRAWAHIEQLYRQLKQNYEDRKDYERAGNFHYGEKEMRRRNPETSWGLRCWLRLYRMASGYGERWVPPLIWAAGLLVICSILYLCLGLLPKSGGPALTCSSAWDWLRSAFYSFRVMTLLRPDDLAPLGYAKLVHAGESLLGPLLLGLFALAVRQKLKR